MKKELLESLNKQRKLMGLNEFLDPSVNIDAKGALSGNKLDLGIIPLEEFEEEDPEPEEQHDDMDYHDDDMDYHDDDPEDYRSDDERDFYRIKSNDDFADRFERDYPDPNEREWMYNRYSPDWGMNEDYYKGDEDYSNITENLINRLNNINEGLATYWLPKGQKPLQNIGTPDWGLKTGFKTGVNAYTFNFYGKRWSSIAKRITKDLNNKVMPTLNKLIPLVSELNKLYVDVQKNGAEFEEFKQIEKLQNDINNFFNIIKRAQATLSSDEKGVDNPSAQEPEVQSLANKANQAIKSNDPNQKNDVAKQTQKELQKANQEGDTISVKALTDILKSLNIGYNITNVNANGTDNTNILSQNADQIKKVVPAKAAPKKVAKKTPTKQKKPDSKAPSNQTNTGVPKFNTSTTTDDNTNT